MKVGLLGADRIGSLHAGLLSARPEVDALVVGDLDAGRAEALAGELGAERGTIEEVLGSGLDAVVIAASTSAHADLIRSAVDAGIPAFCEKPIALGYEETLEVVEKVEARRLIDEGLLGTLYSIRLATHDPEPPHEVYIPTSGGSDLRMFVGDGDPAATPKTTVEPALSAGTLRRRKRRA